MKLLKSWKFYIAVLAVIAIIAWFGGCFRSDQVLMLQVGTQPIAVTLHDRDLKLAGTGNIFEVDDEKHHHLIFRGTFLTKSQYEQNIAAIPKQPQLKVLKNSDDLVEFQYTGEQGTITHYLFPVKGSSGDFVYLYSAMPVETADAVFPKLTVQVK